MPDSLITHQLTTIITRVNDITDPSTLKDFAERCPTRISRDIRTRYDKIVPDIELTAELDCASCGHLEEVGMPLTAQFFWPND